MEYHDAYGNKLNIDDKVMTIISYLDNSNKPYFVTIISMYGMSNNSSASVTYPISVNVNYIFANRIN